MHDVSVHNGPKEVLKRSAPCILLQITRQYRLVLYAAQSIMPLLPVQVYLEQQLDPSPLALASASTLAFP